LDELSTVLQREELAEVKAERANLLASLAALKRDTGKAGGELQQDDIAHLRRDLELKQQKLNELKHVRHHNLIGMFAHLRQMHPLSINGGSNLCAATWSSSPTSQAHETSQPDWSVWQILVKCIR